MSRIDLKNRTRAKRKASIRKNLKGTPQRPRMTIFKSNRFIYIQVIDDVAGNTIVSVNNLQKDNKEIKSTVESASKLGELIGKKLLDKKIDSVVFDRNGYKYHGVVKSVADGARKAGLQF